MKNEKFYLLLLIAATTIFGCKKISRQGPPMSDSTQVFINEGWKIFHYNLDKKKKKWPNGYNQRLVRDCGKKTITNRHADSTNLFSAIRTSPM